MASTLATGKAGVGRGTGLSRGHRCRVTVCRLPRLSGIGPSAGLGALGAWSGVDARRVRQAAGGHRQRRDPHPRCQRTSAF
ncbi:MAG: hypothetical protein MZU91_12980 [Desulfosudis oleivorans]|nr:hypothetical protein [Desulfosudis oleivorans]